MTNYSIYIVLSLFFSYSECFLYPSESESRQVKSLNGIWRFQVGNEGFDYKWYSKQFTDYIFMPVPGSFNDIDPTHPELRDYLGWVWYQREFYLNKKWSASRIFVYFGAVDHHAIVWCNGVEVGRHSGGHVPFHLEMTRSVLWNGRNLLTVAVNNTLTPYTVPQGYLTYPNDTARYPNGTYTYTHDFDYFDYAGINRNVILYSVPQTFIKYLNIIADSIPNRTLNYEVLNNKNELPNNCTVRLLDEYNFALHKQPIEGCKNSFICEKCRDWNPATGGTVILEVTMVSGKSTDVYRILIGFKTVEWKGANGLKINGNKMYLKGFGMHEDSDIRGRGYDDVMTIRDIGLLLWTGANSIRTSHYPYSEEFLTHCDIWGIAVILEVPACSLDHFSEELYKQHEKITLDILATYKHHPSIVIWSLANEPASDKNSSIAYFNRLYNAARAADPTRPITFVTSRSPTSDKVIGNMDLILLNRYSGWYQDGGRLDLIEYQIKQEISAWNKLYNKPVIVTEYGAGSMPGQSTFPVSMWTEDYQSILLENHFKGFDSLRNQSILSGEMIWNLIDFKTPQEYFRPGFCMKGVFTRQREPKAAAYTVRNRYRLIL